MRDCNVHFGVDDSVQLLRLLTVSQRVVAWVTCMITILTGQGLGVTHHWPIDRTLQ